MSATEGIVRSFASELRERLDGSSKPVSGSWLSRFCKRHPGLCIKKGKLTEEARIGAHVYGRGYLEVVSET
jgi:Tc5 transposase DNA-binding domain